MDLGDESGETSASDVRQDAGHAAVGAGAAEPVTPDPVFVEQMDAHCDPEPEVKKKICFV